MHHDFAPVLHSVPLAGLRPTQLTVGKREVARKRAEWRKLGATAAPDFLGQHMLPVVIGPKDRMHLIDNHHLALALHEEGVSHVLVRIVARLGALRSDAFWTYMDNRNWLHPYDAEGRRQDLSKLPKSIDRLRDDPYRSLAGDLRRAGGYAKDPTPYSEFLWADYLRRRIKHKTVEQDYDAALSKARSLAHHRDADFLPGWCGSED